MRARLMFVLVCLLLVNPIVAFAAVPTPDETGGAEPAQPALPAETSRVLSPDSTDATTKWYTIAGAGFIPYTNSLIWTYGGSGCLAPTTGGYWRANINLPDGAIMKSAYFGFYNSVSSTASTAYIYRYNYLGTIDAVLQLTSTPGSTSTGYHSVYGTIASPGETIVNYTNAYMFSWSGSGNQELCYIQVGYTPAPVFGNFLPSTQKH
jgi:hypothetical protein